MNSSQTGHDTTNPARGTIVEALKKRIIKARDRYSLIDNNLPTLSRSTQSSLPLRIRTRKVIRVADEVNFSGSRLMNLPYEVLTMILNQVTPISGTAWLKLALTSKTFNTIVNSKAFCANHIGKTPTPSIALYLPNHKPHFWLLALARHNELAQSEGSALFLALRISSILYQPSSIHLNYAISERLNYLLVSGAAVLKCIARSASIRLAPSKDSLEYSTQVIHNMLPDAVVLLLRWVFYVIWLKLEKVDTKAVNIPTEELRIHYGRPPNNVAVEAVDPQFASLMAHIYAQQPPFPAPGTGWPLLTLPRPATDLQRLLMIECSLLFGPSEGELGWLLDSHHNMSGPMYWFMRDSRRRILFDVRGRGRFCIDGTRINFPEIGTSFDRRFNSLPNKLGLESPPRVDSYGHFSRDITRQLTACHQELFEMVRSVDFVRLGGELRSFAFPWNRRTE